MTSQSPKIYIYKITFDEVLYYYYGVHKEKKCDEYYMGSPVTNKWCWELYTPKKQILELFEFSDKGWIEAQEVENRLIRPVYQNDKWCLNESCGGIMSLDSKRKNGKKVAENHKKNGTGIYALTPEQKSEGGKKGGKVGGKTGGKISGRIQYELGIGIHGMTFEERSERSKKNGLKHKENKTGVCGRSKEKMIEDGKRGGSISGKKTYECKLGIHSLDLKQRVENAIKGGEKVSSQKWKCTETGYVSNAGALTKYQRARGIDTSKRVRLS
jgi:hypothetical protein